MSQSPGCVSLTPLATRVADFRRRASPSSSPWISPSSTSLLFSGPYGKSFPSPHTQPLTRTLHRHDDHLRLVHRSTSHNFFQPDPSSPTNDKPFTYHLWESLAWDRYLKYYDPDRIHARGAKRGAEREEDGRSDESSFSRLARRWVSEELRGEWRRAVEEGLVEA